MKELYCGSSLSVTYADKYLWVCTVDWKTDLPKNPAAMTPPPCWCFKSLSYLEGVSISWPGTFILPELFFFQWSKLLQLFSGICISWIKCFQCVQGITDLKCSKSCCEGSHMVEKYPWATKDGWDWKWVWVRYVVGLGYWVGPGSHQMSTKPSLFSLRKSALAF